MLAHTHIKGFVKSFSMVYATDLDRRDWSRDSYLKGGCFEEAPMARSRISELLWTTFSHKGEKWKVILTTPALIPRRQVLRAFRNKNDFCVGICEYDTKTIYVDAGQTEDEIGETLMHELFHVGREDYDWVKDHKFFMDQSPLVWGIYKQLGVRPFPPLPEGWQRLQRSSRIWRGKREWA